MSVAISTRTELWAQLVTIDRKIAQTPVCEHQTYRYEMLGCDWCERNKEADRITRCLDRAEAGR